LKKPSFQSSRTLGYIAILAVTLGLAIVLGWTALAAQIDEYGYDWMFRLHPPAPIPAHCLILAIDDATFSALGGVRAYRIMLARALEALTPVQPKVVAIDMVLADPAGHADQPEDDRLARAMRATKNLVLATHLEGGRWENPIAEFRSAATAVGHDRADELSRDGVTRQIPLEERTEHERHWALALETFRLARGQSIMESPQDLQIGNEVIPAPRTSDSGRALRILFVRDSVPQISLQDLLTKPELAERFRGQAVFLGVTSISATYDRVATPDGQGRIPGVEVHAQLFETLERGQFPLDASNTGVLAFCLAAGVLAGLIFAFFRDGGPILPRLSCCWPPTPLRSSCFARGSCSPSLRRWPPLGSPPSPPPPTITSLCGGLSDGRRPSGSTINRPFTSSRMRCGRRSPPFRVPAN